MNPHTDSRESTPTSYAHTTHTYTYAYTTYNMKMRTYDETSVSTGSLSEVAIAPLSTVVGEWSGAMNDCAKWLNGRTPH